MSDSGFQFVDAAAAAKGLGARPARPSPQDVDRAIARPSRDVTGRVVQPVTGQEPEPVSEEEEDELASRFQKLGIKKLNKIQERQDALERKKRRRRRRRMGTSNASTPPFRANVAALNHES